MARSNIRRKRALKRRAAKRPARKGGKSGGIPSDRGQMATIRETVEFTDIDPNIGYNFNFNLSQFRRASALAPNFKWYKAVSVEWIVEAQFNTFQDGTSGSEVTMPYYYQTMNRTQDTTGINLQDIQAMGSKPKKLTGKVVTKYTPNWCSPGLMYQTADSGGIVSQASYGLKAQYSYLACPDTPVDPNTPSSFVPAIPPGSLLNNSTGIVANQVVYNGHTFIVDQAISTGVLQPVARVVCNVVWHFKDPHYTLSPEKYVDVVPK